MPEWSALAERRLRRFLARAQGFPALARRIPPPARAARGAPKARWVASVRIVGAAAMTRLNGRYRGKNYPTDVLSFNAPEIFAQAGQLGELVICLPTLRKQARELGHSDRRELDVLIAHGVLHLLGLDHELGPQEAAEMARWEARLLGPRVAAGLIRRGE